MGLQRSQGLRLAVWQETQVEMGFNLSTYWLHKCLNISESRFSPKHGRLNHAVWRCWGTN